MTTPIRDALAKTLLHTMLHSGEQPNSGGLAYAQADALIASGVIAAQTDEGLDEGPGAPTRLTCPECGSLRLATVERLYAVSDVRVFGNGHHDWEDGEVKYDWESSQTTALKCRDCDWEVAYDEDEDGSLFHLLSSHKEVEG